MFLSRLRLSPLGRITIERCLHFSWNTSSLDMDVWGPSSVTEARTSIMHTFVHFLRSMEYIIMSPHHTTPRKIGKSRLAIEKWRTYWWKSFDQMGRIGYTSFLMHYEHTRWPVRHPSRCLIFGSPTQNHATFQLSLSLSIKHISLSKSSTYL